KYLYLISLLQNDLQNNFVKIKKYLNNFGTQGTLFIDNNNNNENDNNENNNYENDNKNDKNILLKYKIKNIFNEINETNEINNDFIEYNIDNALIYLLKKLFNIIS